MQIEKSAKDFRLLAKVVKKAELIDLSLLQSSTWRSLDALDYEHVEGVFEISAKFLKRHEQGFLAKTKFTLKVSPLIEDEKQEQKEIAVIKTEYVLNYSLPKKADFSQGELGAFCRINAVYNAWPFWREFLRNTCDKMELPLPLLPLLKFRGVKKSNEK